MKIIKNYVADEIYYDNDDSGLDACTVQEAIDELSFNNILTHTNFPNGNPLKLYDPISSQYFAIDLIVTDENGNVVSA